MSFGLQVGRWAKFMVDLIHGKCIVFALWQQIKQEMSETLVFSFEGFVKFNERAWVHPLWSVIILKWSFV